MAKKRGSSPLGNTPGSIEAQKVAAKANLANLTKQLTDEMHKADEDIQSYLQNEFGISSVTEGVVWHLASGKTAVFSEVKLSYEQVKQDTFVTFDVNGRDQTLLSSESLSDLNSLEFQQFYPAVGREVSGRIDVLDGSRRRAWFLLHEGKVPYFRMLVTQDNLSIADAKALAKQIQTAKEHNLREIGLQCLAIKKSNKEITQLQIAQQLGLSQAGVSKAMKAANIDNQLVSLFPIADELSHPDYALLDKVMRVFNSSDERREFVDKIDKYIVNIQAEYSTVEQKDVIINTLKNELKIAQEKQPDQDKTIQLLHFETKGMYARKRIAGRNFSYEFGRVSKDIQDALDHAITEALEKFKP